MIYCCLLDISAMMQQDADIIREKIKDRFSERVNLRKKESVAAKALLCKLLKEIFTVTDFFVDCDEKGKPFIADSDICFNLSHSGDYVLCAVSDANVGCDIQKLQPYNDKVAKRFFTESERRLLEASDSKELDFTVLWTLKESALKFTGEGITGGLDRYDFSQHCKDRSFVLENMKFNSLLFSDYALSICSCDSDVIQLEADIRDIINNDF